MRLLLTALSVVFLVPTSAGATGIAVSPSKLVIQTGSEQASTAYFTVSNPNNQVQVFEIYVDNFQNLIRVDPPVFTLSPGGVKKVAIGVNPQSPGQGSQMTTISVLSYPLSGNGVQIAAGAKISLTITDTPAKTKIPRQNLLVGLVALGSLIAASAWQKLKKS